MDDTIKQANDQVAGYVAGLEEGDVKDESAVVGITMDDKRVSVEVRESDEDVRFEEEQQPSICTLKCGAAAVGVLGAAAVALFLVSQSYDKPTPELEPTLLPKLESPFNTYAEFSDNLDGRVNHAFTKVLEAISPEGSLPGSLQAALSGECPNYAFTWPRDEALTIAGTVLEMYLDDSTPAAERDMYESILKDFASHTHAIYEMNQGKYNGNSAPWNLGWAKYEMDGKMYVGGWCHPQNDGPAGRAMILMDFASKYAELHPEDQAYIKNNVVDVADDTWVQDKTVENPILRDLDYVVKNWNVSDNCEPWEEDKSQHHFYNYLICRRSMIRAEAFFNGTQYEATFKQVAENIEAQMDIFWDATEKKIIPARHDLDNSDAVPKEKKCDIQTTLATIHTYAEEDGFFSPTQDQVLANAVYTVKLFDDYFHINQFMVNDKPHLGTALGRYDGDIYDGFCNYEPEVCPPPCKVGQPWFLATHGMGELIYRAVSEFQANKKIEINDVNLEFFEYYGARQYTLGKQLPLTYQHDTLEYRQILRKLLFAGDSFLMRTAHHSGPTHKMDEQFNRVTGAQMSAGDLTWSYASLITAVRARNLTNPEMIVEGATPGNLVEVEVVVTNVSPSTTLLGVFANTPGLGDNDPCKPVPLFKRRTVRGFDEWSAMVMVPKNANVVFGVVSGGPASCSDEANVFPGALTLADTGSTNLNMPAYIALCGDACQATPPPTTAGTTLPPSIPTFREIDFTLDTADQISGNVTRMVVVGNTEPIGEWAHCNSRFEMEKQTGTNKWFGSMEMEFIDFEYKFVYSTCEVPCSGQSTPDNECEPIWEAFPGQHAHTNNKFSWEQHLLDGEDVAVVNKVFNVMLDEQAQTEN